MILNNPIPVLKFVAKKLSIDTSDKDLLFQILLFASKYPKDFEKITCIQTTVPPINIHRMQKKNPFWVGDFYSANLVVECLSIANINILDTNQIILDLGCSSGSLLRVLRTFHNLKLYGCDPINSAINWAKINLKNIYFDTINTKPPTHYTNNFFSGITAISIFSHHSPTAAKIWFQELSRILKNNAWLLLTYCSYSHINFLYRQKRSSKEIISIKNSLKDKGFYFKYIQYKEDYSKHEKQWGHAVYDKSFFTNIALNCGFEIIMNFEGRNSNNQDVLILKKRDK